MSANFAIEGFAGKRCDVLGMGVSNRPLVSALLEEGAIVCVHDRKSPKELGSEAEAFAARGVSFICGDSYLDKIEGEYLFRSPGIRPDLPEIQNAVARGAVLTSEIEEFLHRCPCPVIGITGSDGKTTTTTITYLLLQAEAERRNSRNAVWLGGNIGQPLFAKVKDIQPSHRVVLELSSFQLQTAERGVDCAVITNITPNHLNWHLDMDEYIAAKARIFKSPCRMLVTNRDDPICMALAADAEMPLTLFSLQKSSYEAVTVGMPRGTRALFLREDAVVFCDGDNEQTVLHTRAVRLPGLHNLANYMAAIGATWGKVGTDTIKEIAARFAGVPHRLEYVRELGGVAYYNSSIDSTPTRTAAALSALPKKPIVICGGRGKHISYAPLAQTLCARAKAVVLTGEMADEICAELGACPAFDAAHLPIYKESAFADAVRCAHDIAKPGDIVLLSPACTSFDAFANFEARGERFRQIVQSFVE